MPSHLKGKPVLRGTQGHPWNEDTISNVLTTASGHLGINDMALNAPNNKLGALCQTLGVPIFNFRRCGGRP